MLTYQKGGIKRGGREAAQCLLSSSSEETWAPGVLEDGHTCGVAAVVAFPNQMQIELAFTDS